MQDPTEATFSEKESSERVMKEGTEEKERYRNPPFPLSALQ
jgi:hypothetical protein